MEEATTHLHSFDDLQKYADRHSYRLLGECQTCRVIKNTRHGRKISICNVVRACKKNKIGKNVIGYLIGLSEIEFKPDTCRYKIVKI